MSFDDQLVEFAQSVPAWVDWVGGPVLVIYFGWSAFVINRSRTKHDRTWREWLLTPPKEQLVIAALGIGIGIGWSVPWAILKGLQLWPVLLFSLLIIIGSLAHVAAFQDVDNEEGEG